MGYRSYFTVEILNPDAASLPDDISILAKRLESISGYEFYITDPQTLQLDYATWYEWHNSMAQLSAEFPDVKFSVFADGEGGAKSILDALGGVVDERMGEVVYPPRRLWSDTSTADDNPNG